MCEGVIMLTSFCFFAKGPPTTPVLPSSSFGSSFTGTPLGAAGYLRVPVQRGCCAEVQDT